MKTLILSALYCCLSIITATAHTWYFDSVNGNDNNDGSSPKQAWQTFGKLSGKTLKEGDRILLHRGSVFNGPWELSVEGTVARPIVVDAYGKGKNKPVIKGLDRSMYAVRIFNSSYLKFRNIEIANTGHERLAGRTGLKIECLDYGVSRNIHIDGVTVRDVNGSLVKREGGGSGILIVNGGKRIISTFENMIIENCHIMRCSRNAMIWDGYADRKNWHPSLNTIVRNNLIEQVPGDGIVPIGCSNAIIEYNIMRDCPDILPAETEAAAGFWPWSCDNTLIQFNEVYGHKAPWDGQAYDSDYNCKNTTIQYNYSHDNYGGIVLVCNSGAEKGYNMNTGTVVRYNISIGDGIRPVPARGKIFSPIIHIGGPVKNTLIERNILHMTRKPSATIDRSMVTSDTWDGYADSTIFKENIFYAEESSCFNMTESTNNTFKGNCFIGKFKDLPFDSESVNDTTLYGKNGRNKDRYGRKGLQILLNVKTVCGVKGYFVDPEKIEKLFKTIYRN